jgi:nicotinamidase-related amidase
VKKALLIIDVQNAFDDPKWGKRNNPAAEKNIQRLLAVWRKTNHEVIFIQHKSQKINSVFHPEHEGFQFKEMVKPKEFETVIEKEVNSAFIGTSLEDYLNNKGIKELVITGLTTPHCVSTSTRMSGNLGYHTYLLNDATAAFGLYDHNEKYIDAEIVHDVSLATIHKEFATVLSSQEYIENYL